MTILPGYRFTALFWLMAISGSGYGWAQLFHRITKTTRYSASITLAIGISVLVFLGGIVNLLQMAVPSVLFLIIAGGLIGFLFQIKKEFASFDNNTITEIRVPFVVSIMVFCFVWFTLFPPAVFNIYDDFDKYFPHVVRMLETGTVFGSPLSAIGMEALGGQAFLQGLMAMALPIETIIGIDLIIGLILAIGLATSCTGKRGNLPVLFLCILSILCIDPKFANVSILYLNSALLIALCLLGKQCSENKELPSPWLFGVLYAAMAALKTQFIVVMPIHLISISVILIFFVKERSSAVSVARWAVLSALSTLFFLSPWLALHTPHYRSAWHIWREDRPFTLHEIPADPKLVSYVYDGSSRNYFFLVVALCLAGTLAAWTAWKHDQKVKWATTWTLGSLSLALWFYLLSMTIILPMVGENTAMRYLAPILIGTVPTIFGFFSQIWSLHPFQGVVRPLKFVPLVIAGISLWPFFPGFLQRTNQAIHQGSILYFSEYANSPFYHDFNQYVFSGSAASDVKRAQESLPEHAPVLAWINTPALLDYARNPIFELEQAGLMNPWAEFPPVFYVIWEYNGMANYREGVLRYYSHFGSRGGRAARLLLALIPKMKLAAKNGTAIFDDGQRLVFRLAQPL